MYTAAEYAEMPIIYGRRLPHPNYKVFLWLVYRARETGSLVPIVLPELQRFYGTAIVIITPVEMPIPDINRPLSIIIFVVYLSVYRVVLGRIYD
jgi:hypothetical protein